MIGLEISVPELLLILVCSFAGLHVLYVLIYWIRILGRKFPNQEKTGETRPVSVIIAAKNEAKNLEENLQYFLNQDYPNYEVVVVNDGSWDETPDILEQLQQYYPHLKVSEVPENERYQRGKKFALFCGIKAASHEYLLFSDADCKPVSANWIRNMQAGFAGGRQIVLGYGAYAKQKNLLNLLIQYDTVLTALQYCTYAFAGNAYMGVGRNLAYTKSLFYEQKGFSKHIHHFSGDDDLFVNGAATPDNVSVVLAPASFTESNPKEDFNNWLRQKRRHASTGRFYKASHKFLLSWGTLSWYFCFLIFLGAFPYLLLREQDYLKSFVVLGSFLFAFGLRWLTLGNMAVKVKQKRVAWFFPLLELIFPFLHAVFTLDGLFSKKKEW